MANSILDVNDILNEYSLDIQEGIEKVTQSLANQAATELKNTKGTYKVRTGKYNKGWRVKTEKGKGYNIYFTDLEEILIEADVGVNLTLQTIDELLQRAKKEKITELDELNDLLIDIPKDFNERINKNYPNDFNFLSLNYYDINSKDFYFYYSIYF